MKIVLYAGLLLFAGLLTSCVGNPVDTTSNISVNSQSELSQSPTPKLLTPESIARRDEVEAKMMRGEFLHDGPSELINVGDVDSVPAILVVLKKNPPYPNGTMVCTRAHALQALKQITGADPGLTNEAWFAWWEDYKRNNPASRRLEK